MHHSREGHHISDSVRHEIETHRKSYPAQMISGMTDISHSETVQLVNPQRTENFFGAKRESVWITLPLLPVTPLRPEAP
jgi:hypothetical protein